MADKRQADSVKFRKRARKAITLDVKLEVLRRFDAGERLSQISNALKLANSTLGTIRENKDKIIACARASTPASACKLYFHRGELMENMERMLTEWIVEQTESNSPVTATAIQEKAREIYVELHQKSGDAEMKPFAASKGWLTRFKRRHVIYGNPKVESNTSFFSKSLNYFQEQSKANDEDTLTEDENGPTFEIDDVPKYPGELKRIIEEGGYTSHQVFSVKETGLYWKKMPKKTFISKEEKKMTTFKPSKNRLTVLLGGNAAGDFKIKPLLIYHSENPKELKGFSKPNLPVIWRSNDKSSMTPDIFQEWFTVFFCPAVERYCAKYKIPNKALLVLDNSSCRPINLNDISDSIRIEYMPDDNESLEPMERGIIDTFKANYLRRIFQQLKNTFDRLDKTTIKDFWKNYCIMDAIDNITEAWENVNMLAMNRAWSNLWPDCLQRIANHCRPEAVEHILQEVVAMAHSIGFENISRNDLVDLLDSHDEDISEEDRLLLEQELKAAEREEDEDDPPPRQLSIPDMAKAFALIEEGLQMFVDNDPSRERSLRALRGVNERIRCYKELYKEKLRRSKQATDISYLHKEPSLEDIKLENDPLSDMDA